MRKHKALLFVLVSLLAWKAVRTDWIVVAPYWFGDPTKTTPPGVFTTYDYVPPIRPIGHPPTPRDCDPDYNTWDYFFPGGGAWGITGPPRLHPNWTLIVFKLIGGFIVLYPTFILLSFLVRLITRLTAPTSIPNGRNA